MDKDPLGVDEKRDRLAGECIVFLTIDKKYDMLKVERQTMTWKGRDQSEETISRVSGGADGSADAAYGVW